MITLLYKELNQEFLSYPVKNRGLESQGFHPLRAYKCFGASQISSPDEYLAGKRKESQQNISILKPLLIL